MTCGRSSSATSRTPRYRVRSSLVASQKGSAYAIPWTFPRDLDPSAWFRGPTGRRANRCSNARREGGKDRVHVAGPFPRQTPLARYALSVPRESSINDFGLLIAYVLPGFTALWGASYLSEPLRAWIGVPPTEGQTVGGFLYTTVASVGAGLTVSTLRWMVIDKIHHHTGLRPPELDFALLRENSAAFGIVVEHNYRYYQWAANSLVALLVVLVARRCAGVPVGPTDLALLPLLAVLFVGSRDSLRRYYSRGGQILREEPQARSGRPARPARGRQAPDADDI